MPAVEGEASPPTEEPPDQAVPKTTEAEWMEPEVAAPRPEYRPTAEFLPRLHSREASSYHQTNSPEATHSGREVKAPTLSEPATPRVASSLPEPLAPVAEGSRGVSLEASLVPENTAAVPLMSPSSSAGLAVAKSAEPVPVPVTSRPNGGDIRSFGTRVSTQASDLMAPQAEATLRPQFSTQVLTPPDEVNGAVVSAAELPAQTRVAAEVDAIAPPVNDADLSVPTSIEPGVLSPLVTNIPLDGDVLEFDQEGEVAVGASFGEDRSANLQFDGTFTLERSLGSRTTAGNVTVLEQYQTVLRGQNIVRERQLSIARENPVTVLGQNVQLSFVADCLDGTDAVCSYTPGLVTDRARIDPDTLLPTQIDQTSQFRDVVTPASLAAMQAPGFQMGADGQAVGLDLYFPNTAILPGNDLSMTGEAIRDEQFETMPAIAYSEVFQTVVSNANEAALARTIRGPAIVFDTEQPITNLILAAASMLLPEVQPFVPETSDSSNPNINQGLFYAANNTRIPSNSLTLYQAGVGHSTTPSPNGKVADLPSATFNAVWLGLSPVTERSYSSEMVFRNVSDPRVILAAGGEGGGVNAPEVISLVNGETFVTPSLGNVYTQNYFTLFEQDADRLETFVQNDRIRYYPHLSFTGNITGTSDILRYYAGTIAGETIQAYGGLNYQGQTSDGWSYRAGAIGYINPNYDRYSNLSAGVSKQLAIGDRETLTLGTSFNWALDQDTTLEDIEQTGQGSDITVQARLDLGDISIGASQIIGDVLPHSQASRTVLDTAVQLGEDVSIAAFWAPFDNATSSPRYGVLADIGFRIGEINPHFVFSWQNTRYEYGDDLLGNELTTDSNTFEMLFKLDW